MKSFDLVIFDCDGVLVDSERITNAVLAEMLCELGIPSTAESVFEEFVGNSMSTCLEMIKCKLGCPVPTTFLNDYWTRIKAALEKSLVAIDGVEEALDQISCPICVASSGDHVKMKTTLGITGLLSRFEDRLFSVTEVARGKPHPDVFLYACEKMGAVPERCAVVEDTAIGVRAGVKAGMQVFGYAGFSKAEKLAAAGAVTFSNMRDLPLLLQNAGE